VRVAQPHKEPKIDGWAGLAARSSRAFVRRGSCLREKEFLREMRTVNELDTLDQNAKGKRDGDGGAQCP